MLYDQYVPAGQQAAQHPHPRRRPGLRRSRRLRRHRHEDAEPRSVARGHALRLLRQRIGVHADPRLITGDPAARDARAAALDRRPDTPRPCCRSPGRCRLRGQAGYATALIGKWHLGFKPEAQAPRHGFGYFWGYLSGISVVRPCGGDGQRLWQNESPTTHPGYFHHETTRRRSGSSSSTRASPFSSTSPTARRIGRSSRRRRHRWPGARTTR